MRRTYANLEEMEGDATALLPPAVCGYYVSGAEGESTLRDNRAAFARYRLLPRVLVDVSAVDTSCLLLGTHARWHMLTNVLTEQGRRSSSDCASSRPHPTRAPAASAGQRLAAPIVFAPMAMQRLCDPEGELAMARAAAAARLPYTLSTMATASLEEVAGAVRAAPPSAACHPASSSSPTSSSSSGGDGSSMSAPGGGLWYQIYVLSRRDVTAALVADAERLGYKALVVTVDAPRLGERFCCSPRSALRIWPSLAVHDGA